MFIPSSAQHILRNFQLINFLLKFRNLLLHVLNINNVTCNTDYDLNEPNEITPPSERRNLRSRPILDEPNFDKIQRVITQQI